MVCMNPILKAYDEKAKEFIKKVCFDEAMDGLKSNNNVLLSRIYHNTS